MKLIQFFLNVSLLSWCETATGHVDVMYSLRPGRLGHNDTTVETYSSSPRNWNICCNHQLLELGPVYTSPVHESSTTNLETSHCGRLSLSYQITSHHTSLIKAPRSGFWTKKEKLVCYKLRRCDIKGGSWFLFPRLYTAPRSNAAYPLCKNRETIPAKNIHTSVGSHTHLLPPYTLVLLEVCKNLLSLGSGVIDITNHVESRLEYC